MDALLRVVREFFAPPALLTTSGAPSVATPSSTAAPSASTSMPPLATGRGGATGNAYRNKLLAVVGAKGTTTSSQHVATVMRALRMVLGILRRHAKSLVTVVILLAAAHTVRRLMQRRRRARTKVSHSALVAAAAELRAGGTCGAPISRQSGAISDGSCSHHVTPRKITVEGRNDMQTYFAESLTHEEDGKLYVLHSHGEYVEVWEADEYGQVKALNMSGNFGDPDEHCEELLGHFRREASMTM